jgi:hypothetical protein
MQTNIDFPSQTLPAQGLATADRSWVQADQWVQEDRAQTMLILRACAVWAVAVLGAVLLTLIMTAIAHAAPLGQAMSHTMSPADGWLAKGFVAMAVLAAAGLTTYMVRDMAQRVPNRRRTSGNTTDHRIR